VPSKERSSLGHEGSRLRSLHEVIVVNRQTEPEESKLNEERAEQEQPLGVSPKEGPWRPQ
jgi:hypothetical protein